MKHFKKGFTVLMTRKIVAVVMAAAMILTSGISVPARAAEEGLQKSYDYSDVESVDFYALRDVYAGIDDVFCGLGATFTFKDGAKFEYDGCYPWNSYTYAAEGDTENNLITDREMFQKGENWIFSFGGFSMTVTGCSFDEHYVIDAAESGTITLKIENKEQSQLPIEVNDTVEIKVAKNPVKSIEPFGVTEMVDADDFMNQSMDNGAYTLYCPMIKGLIVTYENGEKDILTGSGFSLPDETSGSLFVDVEPLGHEGYMVERNRIEIISNQGKNHWEKGKTYPVTVSYMNTTATFQCTVGNQEKYPDMDIAGASVEVKSNLADQGGDLYFSKINSDELFDVKMKDNALVRGQDYEIFGWETCVGDGGSEDQFFKLDGLPSEIGRYRVVLAGKGKYTGAKKVDVKVIEGAGTDATQDSTGNPTENHTHTYESQIVKAMPGANGKITEVCSVCGEKGKETVIYAPEKTELEKSSYEYNGKSQKPEVVVKDSEGTALHSGTDYQVKYSGDCKNVGYYTATIEFQGNYSGNMSLKFTVVPKTTSIQKIKAKKKGFVVKWKKQKSQTSGYQIQYSTSKKFVKKSSKVITVSKNTKTSASVSKLKQKKKYYVRIRTFKNDGSDDKLYSRWSNAKDVKVA